MNLDWVKDLIRLVEESDIDSIEVERLTTRVRIRKSPRVAAAPVVPAPLSTSAVGQGMVSSSPPPGASVAGATDGFFEVTSPMVGTFYRSPAPDASPFVSVGDQIEPGQTLCILEAMKLMNELQSEVAGVVREIAVGNTEPVEFGQVLFRIEPK